MHSTNTNSLIKGIGKKLLTKKTQNLYNSTLKILNAIKSGIISIKEHRKKNHNILIQEKSRQRLPFVLVHTKTNNSSE